MYARDPGVDVQPRDRDPEPSRVSGRVAPGFDEVKHAFELNFSERDELGAAFAAYVDDELVVDLWGGTANTNTGAMWERDTIQPVFSGTKGWVAVCLLILIERGTLDLEAPVARYWPEYAQRGKEATLVWHLVSHLAGVPGLRRPLTEAELCDYDHMVRLVEEEPPYWQPGSRIAYHPLTFGWLCGELIRRIDGRSIGRFVREEIAGPLKLDLWIGLPEEVEPRVAQLEVGDDWGTSAESIAGQTDPVAATVFDNPPGRHTGLLAQNTREFHAAEIPGAGGIAAARSIARLYACLAREGELDGIRLLCPETINLARRFLGRGMDALVARPRAFGVGFALQTAEMRLGPIDSAFGHGGAGGSIHGAWPAQRVAFSYAMNELRAADPDPRAQALLHALRRSLVQAERWERPS